MNKAWHMVFSVGMVIFFIAAIMWIIPQYRIQGLQDGSSEVIYIPTEANLPILEARDKR